MGEAVRIPSPFSVCTVSGPLLFGNRNSATRFRAWKHAFPRSSFASVPPRPSFQPSFFRGGTRVVFSSWESLGMSPISRRTEGICWYWGMRKDFSDETRGLRGDFSQRRGKRICWEFARDDVKLRLRRDLLYLREQTCFFFSRNSDECNLVFWILQKHSDTLHQAFR